MEHCSDFSQFVEMHNASCSQNGALSTEAEPLERCMKMTTEMDESFQQSKSSQTPAFKGAEQVVNVVYKDNNIIIHSLLTQYK